MIGCTGSDGIGNLNLKRGCVEVYVQRKRAGPDLVRSIFDDLLDGRGDLRD